MSGGTTQFNSGGHNLTSDSAGGDGGTGPFGSFGGPGDIRNTDPLLGPLQDNGGPTLTHALLPGAAIDKEGNTNLTTDQRGFIPSVDSPAIPNGRQRQRYRSFRDYTGLVANVSTRLPVGTGDNVLDRVHRSEGRLARPRKSSCARLVLSLPPVAERRRWRIATLEIHGPSNGKPS